MATSKVSPNADEIVSEIEIAAKPERVFSAIVDPAQVLQWWGRAGVLHLRSFSRTCGREGNGAAQAKE